MWRLNMRAVSVNALWSEHKFNHALYNIIVCAVSYCHHVHGWLCSIRLRDLSFSNIRYNVPTLCGLAASADLGQKFKMKTTTCTTVR